MNVTGLLKAGRGITVLYTACLYALASCTCNKAFLCAITKFSSYTCHTHSVTLAMTSACFFFKHKFSAYTLYHAERTPILHGSHNPIWLTQPYYYYIAMNTLTQYWRIRLFCSNTTLHALQSPYCLYIYSTTVYTTGCS